MSGCVDRKLLLPMSQAPRGIRPSAAAVLFRTIPSSVSTNLDIPEHFSFCVRIHLFFSISVLCRPGRPACMALLQILLLGIHPGIGLRP